MSGDVALPSLEKGRGSGMKAVLTLATFVASCTAALAYDDPAVAVCEYSWARGADLSAGGYTRTDAKMAGDTVTLTYDYSVLNTSPKPFVQTCRFEADIDGGLLLATDRSPELQACYDLAEQKNPIIEKYGPNSKEVRDLSGQLTECRPLLQAESDKQNDILTNVAFPLLSMGLYPINPKDTALIATIDRAKFQKECDGKRAGLAELAGRQEVDDSLRFEVEHCSRAGF
ncbi:hypothetical protein CK228_34095 [Mesorhizobium sp. WSM4312]|nr:hypothetical protein CK228_34095 [Mesorhizobium sp. WSM4312]